MGNSLTKVDNSRGRARSASRPRSNWRSKESDFSISRFVMFTPGFCISGRTSRALGRIYIITCNSECLSSCMSDWEINYIKLIYITNKCTISSSVNNCNPRQYQLNMSWNKLQIKFCSKVTVTCIRWWRFIWQKNNFEHSVHPLSMRWAHSPNELCFL